jgi:glycine/D-amino acid oxidase-like deaminating enzyme
MEEVMAHMPSYWVDTAGPEPAGIEPLAGDRTTDVAVIGGGYTGLAAAYRLATLHATDTVLLEAVRIGWGASGRNGGFAMMGMGKVGLAERIARWGFEAASTATRSRGAG